MTDSPAAPKTDRKHLQQIISGLGEGIILIDPDRSIVWANETALTMHGVDDLAGLGKTAGDYRRRFRLRYRNRHALRPEQYPVERVLAAQIFKHVVVEVTNTAIEDFSRVHQVRSLVLTDDREEPELLVLAMQDITERFNAEDRFEKTFNANPAPALICRLSDLRYVRVNRGFLEMTGYVQDNVLGRSVYEIDVLDHAEDKDSLIAALNGGNTIPQTEAMLWLPAGIYKCIIVAGQPIDMGEEPCMLFTFIDLDPRKRVEDTLRHTEERFSKAFKLAPVPMIVSTLDEPEVLEVNDAFIETMGYDAEAALGLSMETLDIWEDRQAYRRIVTELERVGSIRNQETRLKTQGGVLIDCLVSADTVTINDRLCVLSVLQDITERKRTEIELVEAVEAVMQDTSWFSRLLVEKLARIRHPRDISESSLGLFDLTPRERDVLGLMCQGLGDDEIAQVLHVSRNTVRNHVTTLYSKLGVHRRAAAIVWARERGITGYEKRDTHQLSRYLLRSKPYKNEK
jgi:PAS domain S-box-containing protein